MISNKWDMAHLKLQLNMKHADMKQDMESTNIMKEMKNITTNTKLRGCKMSQTEYASYEESLKEELQK